MTVAISFTAKGRELAERVGELFFDLRHIDSFKEKRLSEQMEEAFQARTLIFIGAVGIAVRAIAPYIKSKDTDPAVIVVDENGDYVIPILSGHIGGANRMADYIAREIGATAIITTATDTRGVFAVDTFASENALHIENIDCIRHISGAILSGEKVGFKSDYELNIALPSCFTPGDANVGIYIRKNESQGSKPYQNTLLLKPKEYVLGVGCRKGTDKKLFEESAFEFLREQSININDVCTITSIDLKREEACIREFSSKHRVDFTTYNAETLAAIQGEFTPSAFVLQTTGVDNVSERSAVAFGAKILVKKTVINSITFALAKKEWVFPSKLGWKE